MRNDRIDIALYPVTAEKISKRHKEMILKILQGITTEDIDSYIQSRPDRDTIKKLCEGEVEDRKTLFDTAKQICDAEYISYKQLNDIAYLGELLDIDTSMTGYGFDLYSEDERQKFEYNRLLLNYSVITAAISFVPFSVFKDLLFTTPLQVLMVNNISTVYNFNLDGVKFVKVTATAAGLNIVSRLISNIVSLVLPFKWVVRASVSFASTYAVGVLTKAYIDSNGELGEDNLQEMFTNAYNEGKVIFDEFKEYILKNKDKIVEDFKSSFN